MCLEKLDAAAEVHQLSHTLDVNHKPTDPELYKRKCQWMYNQFSKNVKHPAARAFVTAHSKDMRADKVAQKLCIWAKSSITNQLDTN